MLHWHPLKAQGLPGLQQSSRCMTLMESQQHAEHSESQLQKRVDHSNHTLPFNKYLHSFPDKLCTISLCSVAGVKITDGAYLYSPTCVSCGNVKVNGGEVDGYGRVGEAGGGSAQHNSGKEQHCKYPHSSHDRYFFKIFEVVWI